MIVVVGSRDPESVFRYALLFALLGHETLGVRASVPLLSCIQDPRSGLLVVEDQFVVNRSAHSLINLVRRTPGPKSSIPIIRVWSGPVLTTGHDSENVVTVHAPVTVDVLERAMRSLGLSRGG